MPNAPPCARSRPRPHAHERQRTPRSPSSRPLGADHSGRLAAIRHESITPTSVFDNYIEYAALASRHLWGILTEGAARFGWDKRSPEPRSMRDGRYLVGQGMAGAMYTHWRWPAKARVTLNSDGSALVEAGTHELGTGTDTVMRQVAADAARHAE